MADMVMEGRWEGKGAAVFYLELTLDLLHLLVYAAFFAVVFSTYGIPLHLVRARARGGHRFVALLCCGSWSARWQESGGWIHRGRCRPLPPPLPGTPSLSFSHASTLPAPALQVRDLYWTFRNFQTRVRDFLRYRRLTGARRQQAELLPVLGGAGWAGPGARSAVRP